MRGVVDIKQLQILLADDHDLIRRGLRALIERVPGWKVCGEAETGPKAVAAARRLRPDIAVIDLGMPGLDGLEVTRRIKRHLPTCEVLIFTGTPGSDALIRDVFASGAKGYLLKTQAGQLLIDALRSLALHKLFFTEEASAVMFARFAHKRNAQADGKTTSGERLSSKEQQLVQLLAEGFSNTTVSGKQRVSVRTVENMRAGIMRKLKLISFADLVRYAARNDIIKIE
jgi:DNA-binding NarL/FixJ family response regulator